MSSSYWDESSAMALLQIIIVKVWVKIQGFLMASASVEKYKKQGIRKQPSGGTQANSSKR